MKMYHVTYVDMNGQREAVVNARDSLAACDKVCEMSNCAVTIKSIRLVSSDMYIFA